MTALIRPRPIQGIYEQPFWDAVQRRELRLQRCRPCGHVWYPPGPVCPQCLSGEWSFEPMSGRGRVVAWTVFHRAYFPELPTPYLVVSVALEEGPLLIGNMPAMSPSDVRLDLPVRATFEVARLEGDKRRAGAPKAGGPPGEAAGDGDEWLIVQWEPA